MAYYNNKYHIGLDSKGYVVGQNKNGVRYYQKKRAPVFVNKFGSGDSSYRDATFYQFFAQTNWRNGAKQLKFDDAGKFWKSSDVDTTELEQLSLSKKLVSAGQVLAGTNVNLIESWRADAVTAFGDGSDGALTISGDTTEAPIDSSCSGTAGSTSLTATNASFTAGQKLLIHQTRGTGVGNYEFRTIASYTTGTITLTEPLSNTYTDSGASQAQVRVMKQYSSVTVNNGFTYTAKAWDGNVGGILAFYCNGAVNIAGTMTATGKGFLGGAANNSGSSTYSGEGSAGAAVLQQRTANGNGGGCAYEGTGSASGGGNGTAGTSGGSGSGGSAVGSASLATAFFGGGGGGASRGEGDGAGGNGGGWLLVYGKTITVTGSVVSSGVAGSSSSGAGGGGGAGGSILLRGQTLTLGSGLITAAAGSGGNGMDSNNNGKAGGVGRIHADYSSSVSGTTTPTIDQTQDGSLADSPASTSSTAYSGLSNGKIYTWDNGTSWTEAFDTRALTWYESGNDTDKVIGDTGGTETAQAQSFQLGSAQTIKGVAVYLKKNAGTPGDITVRIETNSSTVPSGSLANANATATVSSFTTSSYEWVYINFNNTFTLNASTTYWIVLKTGAASNDNNYAWASDASTPTYSPGNMAASTDGGSNWSAVSGADAYFRVLSQATQVNCSLVTRVGGTKKMYFGVGEVTGSTNGDGRIYSYDGSAWALNKVFTSDSVVLSMRESATEGKVYVGTGPSAIVYVSEDMSTYTTSKDIDTPQNPGYPYTMLEYNGNLFVGGGSPELVPTQYYNGFLQFWDTVKWDALYPFDFTVLRALEFYDSFMFIGTYHGQLYVYDTSSLSPLFSFKELFGWEVQINAMKYFDDKLYIALGPQDGSGETNVGIWVFDRRGLHLAHTASGVTNYKCMAVINGALLVGTGNDGYVYKLSANEYATSGYYQSSYFDANLPSINKLYQSVTIRHDPLVSGQSINVYYKFKESDSWTQLTTGADNSVNSEEQTLRFATGTDSKKISLKVELIGDGTNAPILRETIMKYTLYPELKWQWTMRLKAKKELVLADGSTETRTATQIRDDLEGLMDSATLYSFVDVDGTAYTVLVNDIDQTSWVVNPDDVNEDEVVINLLEA